jgi:hypothetical protein
LFLFIVQKFYRQTEQQKALGAGIAGEFSREQCSIFSGSFGDGEKPQNIRRFGK